jgi:hypothetical protein
VFSAWSLPRSYKKDKEDRLSQLSFETPACQDMSLGAEELQLNRVSKLAVGRIMARNETGCTKKTSCLISSPSETVMNPLPGND